MLEILEVSQWETPASHYQERQEGRFRLQRTTYQPGFYKLYRVRGYTWFHVTQAIPIMSLQEERDGAWRDWMIDDPFNYYAMAAYCERLSGRVLTSGLGLALAAHELVKNPRVTQVTVVERSPEVISLVQPYLPAAVSLKAADFWEVAEQTAGWDSILLDIWATKGKGQHDQVMTREVWPARERLKARFPETTMVFFGFAPPTDIDIQEPYIKGARW